MLLFLALLGTGSFALYLVVGLAVGFFIVPVIPIMLEFGCEICFPIGEGTTTGFLYAGAHIIAAVCSVFFGWLINGKSK
jgi:FLVCR family feline leukemia virus subgroup C receptor-related protein